MRLEKFVMSVLLVAPLGIAHATPGGLDAAGCHHSKKIGYHCHAQRAAAPTKPATVRAVTAEERRLKRECKGRPNAGACLGYAR